MMDLTLGPIQFYWDAARIRDFYARIADEAPVARVVVGELVCSKRLPYWQDEIPLAMERLRAAGKEVLLTSLALITLKRERLMTSDLPDSGALVEIGDLTTLAHLPPGTPFSVSPLINVYNEGTLRWLAERGATRICLPPELQPDAVARLSAEGARLGVAVEVWGFGRLPLAISGRCYHARLHNRAKDSCQLVCIEDPDGRRVDTLDGQQFLAVNGVQTLSAATAFAGRDLERLAASGISSLRLSPQTGDMVALVQAFADALSGAGDAASFEAVARATAPDGQLANGYLRGQAGADWVAA
jgi:O2-independent ubiquinone biosynthesis protein UbiV